MRISIELAECAECEHDYIEFATYAEELRLEASRALLLAEELNELTDGLATKLTMDIRAAERIMSDLGYPFEPFKMPAA